jgi:hypothetical protein
MQTQLIASQLFYEPSALDARSVKTTGAASSVRAADVGRALRYAKAPRPPATRPNR